MARDRLREPLYPRAPVQYLARMHAIGAGRAGGAAAFSPLSLDPRLFVLSRPPYLFAEEDGTGAVAATDPFGYIQDLSGTGNHPIQATAGARALYQASGGVHWGEYDGTDDTLGLTYGAALGQPWDRISAFRIISAEATTRLIGDGPAGSGFGQLYVSGGQLTIYSGAELFGPTAPADGVDFVAVERHNGASSRVKIDNGSYTTGQAGAGAAVGFFIAHNPGNAEFSNVRHYGTVQFDRALSDEEIALCVTFMAALYGGML